VVLGCLKPNPYHLNKKTKYESKEKKKASQLLPCGLFLFTLPSASLSRRVCCSFANKVMRNEVNPFKGSLREHFPDFDEVFEKKCDHSSLRYELEEEEEIHQEGIFAHLHDSVSELANISTDTFASHNGSGKLFYLLFDILCVSSSSIRDWYTLSPFLSLVPLPDIEYFPTARYLPTSLFFTPFSQFTIQMKRKKQN